MFSWLPSLPKGHILVSLDTREDLLSQRARQGGQCPRVPPSAPGTAFQLGLIHTRAEQAPAPFRGQKQVRPDHRLPHQVQTTQPQQVTLPQSSPLFPCSPAQCRPHLFRWWVQLGPSGGLITIHCLCRAARPQQHPGHPSPRMWGFKWPKAGHDSAPSAREERPGGRPWFKTKAEIPGPSSH